MKFLKIFFLGFISLLLIGFLFLLFYSGPSIELDTADVFEYEPLKTIELNQFEKKKKYIDLSDGTKIAYAFENNLCNTIFFFFFFLLNSNCSL